MKPYLSLLISMVLVSVPIACQKANQQEIFVKEKEGLPSLSLYNVNVPFIREMMTRFGQNGIVRFNSSGGETSAALKISDFIQENDFTIQIDLECLSGCAEVILPSASKLEFFDEPFIGFHQSILSYKNNIETLAKQDTQFCRWGYANKSLELLNKKNLNIDFWQETMKRLKPEVEFTYEYRTCPMDIYNFENDWWFPTSKQLKNLWGLEFRGSVCADNYKACAFKIDQRWKKGTRIVIGDKVYTSKGK